ncbi:hypothetical protein JNUCC0626_18185 [Lentzea sp. JNUCC 0626]|uniref:hypothetical protein n=1 Tax=Lentzea sp. JNUCC 0626 TaxID=3367513 RepID=UPI00374A0697
MIGLLMEEDLFTVLRYGVTGRDPLGKPVTSIVARSTTDGRLEQATTAEGEAFVVDKFRGFFPIGTDVRPGDEVQARSRKYVVEGSPSVERIPGFSALSNVAATLKYVGPVT